MTDQYFFTVGELRAELNGFKDDAEITFGETEAGARLVFYRVKNRRSGTPEPLVHIELSEIDPETPKR